jgi:hypothetical protein
MPDSLALAGSNRHCQANTNTAEDIQRLSMILGRTGRTEHLGLCAQTHKHAALLGTIVVDHSSLLAARELARYLSSGPHAARSITDCDNQGKGTGTSIINRDNQASVSLIINNHRDDNHEGHHFCRWFTGPNS